MNRALRAILLALLFALIAGFVVGTVVRRRLERPVQYLGSATDPSTASAAPLDVG